MAVMAGGPVENIGELNVCVPSGFPANVEPSPQSPVDVERSTYKVAWHEAVQIELNGPKKTGTYEAATPPLEQKPIGATWVVTYKTKIA